eukprot:TRINITY_DN49416_c0_g1_i1.p1 TRINITY_DN49416_c0_g1~~TRINITY_DN49416_c0_g1_i1.p1  ORF type:complete len:689 (-),score=118.68 TRINITY_DN49416_c0_g1_i1:103-2169(-)
MTSFEPVPRLPTPKSPNAPRLRISSSDGKEQEAIQRLPEGAICIILAAGFSKVEQDIEDAQHEVAGPLSGLAGLPKALLPVAGKPMLDHWWEYLCQNRQISDIFVVSNALKYKHFERWATAKGIGVNRVVNSGATAPSKARGVLRDVELGLRRAQLTLGPIHNRELIVFAGDTLFFKDFDLQRILDFHCYKGGSLGLYYGRRDTDVPCERGMCDIDIETSKFRAFVEKPKEGQRGSDFQSVSPLFYILEPATWQQIPTFNAELLSRSSSSKTLADGGRGSFSFGHFVQHAIEDKKLPFFGMRMPGAFHLIGGKTGLEEYLSLDRSFSKLSNAEGSSGVVKQRTFARVGLMGNPSDGFHGKTLSVTIGNFWASVEMWESEQLRLLPHPLFDPSTFSGLADLHFIGRREGYYGGTRLLMATCKKFQELCTSRGIALPSKNFTVRYDTNIPRQVGLAGSSAIVTSLFQALMQFYNLSSEHIPLEMQPSFILSVESELGIQAGLQDRVVQVYQGLVFMDFEAEYMKKHGFGKYERLGRASFDWLASLPFFIAYESDPSDSGKIHTNVRARWDAGDNEVVEGMKKFGEFAFEARKAIENRDHSKFADLVDQNFALRRSLYGDLALGQANLEMVEICKSCGCAVKFPGSGGAVLGVARPTGENDIGVDPLDQVQEALETANYVFCRLDFTMPDK